MIHALVELGYLDTVGPVEIESITTQDIAARVRDAIEATMDELTPAERTVAARLADLVYRCWDRAVAALQAQIEREHGLQ
ncbi:hypothetical protein [Streptomyces olivaceus]|uniref:hypothetical protein n=1 Tax=Streptomyces olivaceus TaxID=47716 RepID=UPI001CCCDA78|nr:hypothetical protein [Streptomyces olivaceus]MBZ6284687.1 hypothetical protein [Streptomyces olivaceus]